jgi:FkbM family methyltransferase
MNDKSYYENYFLNNKSLFHGEYGHNLLLEILIPLINSNIENNNNLLNIFIDVGSCIGDYTNNLLKMQNNIDNSLIYSFEPNNINYDILSKNIVCDKIIYKNIALSNKKSEGFLYNFEGHSNFVGNQIAHINNSTNDNKKIIQQIQIDTLENILLNEIKDEFRIRFIKIDTEGNDTNVIKGLGKFIQNVDYMIFECSDCLDDSRGPSIKNPFSDIIKYLDDYNFTSFMISTNGLLPIYGEYFSDIYENNKQWSNIFTINKNILNDNILKALKIL